MKRHPIKRSEGLRKARRLKEQLVRNGVPLSAVYLYGSVARDEAHEWSDIDVAIVCRPFRPSRHEENMAVRGVRRDIDIRIEPVCLHPDDFQNKFFGLAREVRRTGLEV